MANFKIKKCLNQHRLYGILLFKTHGNCQYINLWTCIEASPLVKKKNLQIFLNVIKLIKLEGLANIFMIITPTPIRQCIITKHEVFPRNVFKCTNELYTRKEEHART